VVHIAKEPRGRRVVTSIREVVGYEGPMVLSNEVLAPDATGRAVPTGRPLQDRTLDALVDAGFEPSLLDVTGGGWGW
jgi:hypothetical protein